MIRKNRRFDERGSEKEREREREKEREKQKEREREGDSSNIKTMRRGSIKYFPCSCSRSRE